MLETYRAQIEQCERLKVELDLIHDAIRQGTLSLRLTPVLMGSAYKNKGVQCLLDAVARYLPSPAEGRNTALDLEQNEQEVLLQSSRCLVRTLVAAA